MSDWQQIIKDQSIATLEKLADKFGRDVIDVEALKPAFENFQMRITPAALDQIKEVGDPMWSQYVPTVEELDVHDGMIDSLDEDGDSPVPNITHRYPDRALFLVSRSALRTAASAPAAARLAIRRRSHSTSTSRRSSTCASTPRSAMSL